MNRRIVRMIWMVLALIATTWILANTSGIKNWNKNETAGTTVEEPGKPDPAQSAMLSELISWLKPFDSTNVYCYYDALLTAVDRTDSANAMTNVPFRYAKKGGSYYFCVDKSENLNVQDVYLMADHNAKKIIVASPKNILHTAPPDLSQMLKKVEEEEYEVSRKTQNGLVVISMVSPYNINLREFSVAYDSISRMVKRITVRQPEITDHLNPAKEKLLTIDIKELSNTKVPDSCFRWQKYLVGRKAQWQCAPAYSEYELVVR